MSFFDRSIGRDFLEGTENFRVFPFDSGVSPDLTPRFQIIGHSSGGPPKSLVLLATLTYGTPDDQVCFKTSASDTTCHKEAAVVVDITEKDGKIMKLFILAIPDAYGV